jgi:diketogulonate reductase-like aldo/keto reductase
MSTSNIPLITLNNGKKIPQLGYGTYCIEGDEKTENCVLEALKIGYRHIDTAHAYQNEKGVGSAIKKSGIPRNEIFLTSKLWITDYGEGKTLEAIDKMLKRLDTDYIDLLLLHFPFNDYLGAYKDMEKAFENGKVKSIGISNFEDNKFEDFLGKIKVKPVLNQIETHPYFINKDLRERCFKNDIKIEAWAPIGHGMIEFDKENIFTDLGKKYNKSVYQIVLRWHIQKGVIVIPKCVRSEKMKENFEIFDFNLTDEEMNKIDSLDGTKNRIQVSEEELIKEVSSLVLND